MSWTRLDDGFVEHSKIEGLSDRAFRLHIAGLCHCSKNLTDGYISEPSLRALRGRIRATQRHVDELVGAGVWIPYEHQKAYLVRDFLEYNPTAAEIREKREKRQAAGRLGGLRSGEARAEAKSKHLLRAVVVPPARPLPKDQVLLGLGVEKVVDNSLRSVGS